MKTAIVTGATGLIGTALLRELVANNYHVFALVRSPGTGVPLDLANVTEIVCDLAELSTLPLTHPELAQLDPSPLFFHLGWAGVWGPERTAVTLQLDNIKWTVDAIDVAAQLNCARFVGIGSIWEFGVAETLAQSGERPGPNDIYGAVKLTSRMLGKMAAHNAGIAALWALPVGVYGPGDTSPGVVNYAIQSCINDTPAQFSAGTQNFDVLYLTDVARAIRLVGERGKPFHEYVLGSGQAGPLRDFLTGIRAALNPGLPIEFGVEPFKGVNIPLEAYDISSLTSDTGFVPEVSFPDGVKAAAAWIAQNNKA